MLTFLSAANDRAAVEPAEVSGGVGEVDGITYRVRGSGPPLVLLPLSLARSQWEPFIPDLAAHYTTILLGGAHLGVVPLLEARMQGGYRNVVRSVVDTAQPQPGDKVLEVGCGPGPVARWLARYLLHDDPITAVDVNGYLLGEAASLTNADGLGDRIEFQHGDAESLPFDADCFDVTLSFTVMEEVDADRMLAELVRVTRPGGRVGVVVRATDLPRFLNVSLARELESKLLLMSAPGVGVEQHGCGDSSLYRRFVKAGLSDLIMGPQLAPETLERSVERMRIYVDRLIRALPAEDARQFSEAINQAVEDRTLVYAEPFHCAVGVKR
jgi:SAM-dependent methyltransferase